MKNQNRSTFRLAKNLLPIGLAITVQKLDGVQAAGVDTQAHIQEIATLVQSALQQSGAEAGIQSLSTAEINQQIHSTVEEAIKTQAKEKANSKLGFLQKVVTLECFFGGSDCLFRDKQSMMQGKVTEFAKKRFEDGNPHVDQYLTQVTNQVNNDLQASAAIKSLNSVDQKQQEAQLNKQLHESVQGLLKMNQKEEKHSSPAHTSMLNTREMGAKNVDARSQTAQIPIDEVQAIGVKVAPTYALDDILSVTVKAFRKVIGYDTFDSILRKDRNETKDPNDYYNVTVSMMIKRRPESIKTYEVDKFEGGKTLSDMLDKGFPYDDADIDLNERAKGLAHTSVRQIVGKMDGENVTKSALKNLITDKTTPVTAALVQLDSDIKKSDADNLSTLFDHNVTRGALKNLVTDKPSPITVGLAQKSDADNLSTLFDHNVTRGALKNLVTDKPSPITVGLAQKSDADNLSTLFDHNVTRGALKNLVTDKPSPITVGLAQKSDADNLSTLFDHNVTRGALKNLVTDKPSPITVGLAQKSDADNLSTLFDHNVTRGALKNLVTDKPSPITVGLAQKSDADNLSTLFDHNVTRGALKNLVTDKPSPITVGLAQTMHKVEKSDADNLSTLFDHNVTRGALKNLVTDKPSPITVGLAQTTNPVDNPPFNNWSVNQPSPPHAKGAHGKEDLGLRDIVIDGVNGFDFTQVKSSLH